MNRTKMIKGACLVAAASMLSPLATAEDGVKISGWMNEAMSYYDDGVTSDITQSADNGTTLGSRMSFTGNKDFDGGLSAGFEMTIEPNFGLNNGAGGFATGLGAPSVTPLASANAANFDNNNAFGSSINLLASNIYVAGGFGKVTIGTQSMPTDNIAVLADPSMTLWSRAVSPVFFGNGFGIVNGNGAAWGTFLQCLTTPGLGIGIDCNGIYRNGIRYDLPAFGPVSVAIGYANDDIFDIAIKYSGTIAGLTANVHGGYAVNADGGTNVGAVDGSDMFSIEGGLMDPNSGIYGVISYQTEEADGATVANVADDTDAWWFKVGIKRDLIALGATNVSFNYGNYNDQYGATAGVTGSTVEKMGVSLDQYIGSSLIVYASWQNLSLDDVEGANAGLYSNAEDLDMITMGLTYFF